MKKNHLVFCVIFLSHLITSCATTNHFNIQLGTPEAYDKINLLMREIYQNARDGNVDFFRPIIERNRRESALQVGNVIIDVFDEFEERSIIRAAESYMIEFVRARIYRTYKRRAFLARNGILFDFVDDYFRERGGTNFLLFLSFDEEDNVFLYNFFVVR